MQRPIWALHAARNIVTRCGTPLLCLGDSGGHPYRYYTAIITTLPLLGHQETRKENDRQARRKRKVTKHTWYYNEANPLTETHAKHRKRRGRLTTETFRGEIKPQTKKAPLSHFVEFVGSGGTVFPVLPVVPLSPPYQRRLSRTVSSRGPLCTIL